MTLGEKRPSRVTRRRLLHSSYLLDLPDDVLYILLSYCDLQSLGRLARVCRRLSSLAHRECVWIPVRKRLTLVRDCRLNDDESTSLGARQQCKYAVNWSRDHKRDIRLVHHRVKQMPWLQRDEDHLWISYKNLIRCYRQKTDGFLQELPLKTLRGHRDDVSRFVAKENVVVSGSCDHRICVYSSVTGENFLQLNQCHTSDIQAVDFHDNVIVSVSRDATVKLWNMSATEGSPVHTILAQDRVWSVAMNPHGGSFATGTAGINNVPPLRIWETVSGQLVGVLGSHYKYGAGVLDMQYESPNILLTCGYDTFIRMWDLRKSYSQCVMMWEEPFDSTIYCVRSDGNHSMVAGTAHYGMVRLWDKRKTQPVQLYYTGRSSSPVYSLAFDAGHLYVALDKGINMLDFTVH